MTSRHRAIRFAAGSPDRLRSSTWRVWTERDGSAYVSVRQIGGVFKASLHPREWRIAFKDLSEARRVALRNPPTNRAIDVFPPSSEIAPGVRRGVTVLIPPAALGVARAGHIERGEIHWLPAVSGDDVLEVSVLLTTASVQEDWPGQRRMGTQLVGQLPLASTTTLWVIYRTTQPPASTITAWLTARDGLAPTAQARVGENSDVRGFFIGTMPADGSRFFVDMKFPDAPPVS